MIEKDRIDKSLLRGPGGRSFNLAEVAKGDKPQDLTLNKDETATLSYKSKEFKKFYREIKPKSADDVKDLLGVPEFVGKFSISEKKAGKKVDEKDLKGTVRLRAPMPAGVDIAKLSSKLLSPKQLSSHVGEEETEEMMSMAHMAMQAYVYGDWTKVMHWKPALDEYLRLRDAVIVIPVLNNIIVNDGATLHIAPDTHAVYANKIQMYGSGRIVCDGPTTFDCDSFEGEL